MESQFNNAISYPLASCQVCGRRDETIRAVVYPYVISLLFITFRRSFAGTWCQKHRRRHLFFSSIITACLGWLGIPYGFLYTPTTLFSLARGGVQDSLLTSQMLSTLGEQKLLANRDPQGAIRCFEESLRFQENPEIQEKLARLHLQYIPGFYKNVLPLSKTERLSFRKLPWKDRQYAASLGVKELHGEKGFSTLERLWARPTLECNGIWGGYTGQGAKTVLPSKAYAKISMRLVPNQTSAAIARLFEKHMKKIAPKTVSVKVRALHGGEPALTPIESPGVRAAVVALEKGFGKKPLYQREGGSIPIVVQFKQILGIDTVLLGFGLAEGNAHAPNEFIVLENFFGGIKTTLHFYNELPAIWAKDRKKR